MKIRDLKFKDKLLEDLRKLVNINSIDTASDTPDYIIAEYLESCIDNFVANVKKRDSWWKFHPEVGGKSTIEK